MGRKMKRAFSYIRFSKPEQLKGDSLRRQLEWGVSVCERFTWFLDESLAPDQGYSGFHGINTACGSLGLFLVSIKEGKVLPGDILLLESIDRLTREGLDEGRELVRSILKAGVEIYTREPERHYTKADLNNIGSLIELMVYLERAYNESKTKSMRGLDWWKKQRAGLTEKKPIHLNVPGWLRLSADKSRFEKKPEAVKAVKLIYKLAGQGLGINPITAKLNRDGVPVIGRGKVWVRSYVAKILSDRAVLGEYQPCKTGPRIVGEKLMKSRKRIPDGEIITNYFPPIISEEEWYQVRHGAKERGRSQRGRKGAEGGCIFRGLIVDARDGLPMQLCRTGNQRVPNARCLVSSGARNGLPGSQYLPFPYQPIEDAFLELVRELKTSDVIGDQDQDNKEEEIASLSGRLEEINHNITRAQAAALQPGATIDTILTLLAALDTQKKEVATKLDNLKAEAANQQPAAAVLGEMQTLAKLLQKQTGEERQTLKNKIKSRIAQLVTSINFITWDKPDNYRLAEMQIYFRSGHVRTMFFQWKRKGKGRSIVEAITGNLALEGKILDNPSPTTIMPLVDLRNYRNQEFGGWYETKGGAQ